MSSTSVVATTGPVASTLQGACRRRLPNLGTCRQNFSGDTYQGGATVNITTTSKATSQKSEGWSFGEKNFGSLRCQEPGNHITTTEVKSKSMNSGMTLILGITERGGKVAAGRKVYVSSGSRSNRSATARAASSTPSLAASADPSTGPCTAGSRGDARITAPEAHQHMVSHRLC
jgi:hypothetical protein